MKRLCLLDYGRFLAAIAVLLFHYTFNGIANGKITSISHIPSIIEFTKYGYLGVDFFFMISGYVIFMSARTRTPTQFAVSRAIRLYPAYWFAIIFTSIFAIFWGGHLMSVSAMQIVLNFTMFQSYLGVQHVDGVYWTLVYEVQFYALVFFILFFGGQKYISQIFVGWPFLMLFAVVIGVDGAVYLGGYFCYFASGALFALMLEKVTPIRVVSLLVSVSLALRYSLLIAAEKEVATGHVFSDFIVLAAVVSFYAFFVLQSLPKARDLDLSFSRMAGALTYPIYLIHAHFGYMAISRFATEENKLTVYFFVTLAVIFVSYALHLVAERKLAPVWRWLFGTIVGGGIGFAEKGGDYMRAIAARRL